MDKKKILILFGLIAYVLFAIFIAIKMPDIMSGGNQNIKTSIMSGQIAEVTNITINLNSFNGVFDISQKDLKMGETIYLTRQNNSPMGEVIKISSKNNHEFYRAVIQSINNNTIYATQYAVGSTAGSGFKPGMGAFQVIIFLTLIFIPAIILGKEGMISLDFLSGLSLPSGRMNLSGRKNKKSKYGDQGTGYIASVGELRELGGKDGFTISKNFRLSASKSYEHVLVLGPTGSGKSSSFFIPNLLDLDGKHSAVVTDPKGEMYRKCSHYLKTLGYNIVKLEPFNLTDDDYRYNPILITDEDEEIHEMAQLILTNGGKSVELATGASSGNAEWVNMSVPLLAAAMAYVKEYGKRRSVTEAIDIILNDSLDEMEAKFKRNKIAYRQFSVFKQSSGSEKTMSSIKSVLTSNVQLFLQEKIENFTTLPVTYNEFGKKSPDMSKLFDPAILRRQPTVLFVCVPEKRSTYMMPLMSVFYTQLLDMTLKEAGCPILFFLDEFANIGIIPSISNVAATARSREIGLSLGLQGVEQLERNYGKENAADLLNNLKTKLIYSGLTGDSAQYVSDLSGVTTIETKNYSSGGMSGATTMESLFAGSQVSKSGTRRELITKDEVRTMHEDTVLIIAHNKQPVYDKKNSYYKFAKYQNKLNQNK